MFYDNLILDGRHLLWRTADAFSELSAEVGGEDVGTGGMYGFLVIAARTHNKYRGRVSVAWEGPKNFRHELFPGYKARDTKGKTEEEIRVGLEKRSDLEQQEKRLVEILTSVGVHQYRGITHEADDVIGTLARRNRANGESTMIYSGDSDLRQLVGRLTCCASPVTQGNNRGTDALYLTRKDVKKKHLVNPNRIAQLKALAGDSSDKIPGVPGVGDKTAARLLNYYGSLFYALKAARRQADWLLTERIRLLILSHTQNVCLYHRLTKIQTDIEMEEMPCSRKQEEVVGLFRQYKFRSLSGPAELYGIMRMGKL